MLVDSTTQDGVGQRVALCLYFPAAVDELMTVLCCVYGVQHDGECAAGRILMPTGTSMPLATRRCCWFSTERAPTAT